MSPNKPDPRNDMTTQRTATLVLCLVLPFALVSLIACGGGEADQPDVVKPITSSQPADGMGMPPAPAGAGALDIQLPESWVEQAPSNSMRLLQAGIPGEAGDGEFALFYFGAGGGGGVEANIQRWLGQVSSDDGSDPVRETFESGNLTIHTVEAKGTLTASPMSMSATPPAPQPDSMLLGAVVEGPGGPWFLKVTGPEATVGPQREAFFEMVRNLTVGG